MTELDPALLDIPTLLALAGASTNEYVLGVLREAGHPHVRIAHGYVFQRLLHATPTVTELADELGVTQQAVSKTVLELERIGYVARRVDGSDSRVRRVALTSRGQAVIDRARSARAALEARLTAELGARSVSGLRRALLSMLALTGGVEAVRGRRVREPRA